MLNYRIEKKSPNAQLENEDMGILAMELWYIGSFQVFLPDIVAFFTLFFFLFPLHFLPVGDPIWVMMPSFRITVLNVWILFYFLFPFLVPAHLSKLQMFEKQIE